MFNLESISSVEGGSITVKTEYFVTITLAELVSPSAS